MFGGRRGISSLALIESALGRPYSGYHRSITQKAAALLESIVGNHGFVDGNKRTALMSALVFLGLNGQRLDADPGALYELVDGVAAGSVDKAEVSVFLRRNSAGR